ncbi:MAG: XrtA/PEP-CTERM system exopolysaccharide export protein [Gammaproteobacteria bacterium]
MTTRYARTRSFFFSTVVVLCMAGCAANKSLDSDLDTDSATSEYRIGPGDNLRIFVWRNPEISTEVPVRPDGKISTPLVEDMVAVGKTPTELADDIEQVLATYVKNPMVNVIVTDFVGAFSEQIRVVGQAANPKALPYRSRMTLLDVMIEVGGLTEFAAGNRAKIVRRNGSEQQQIRVRLEDLIGDGDVRANMPMAPGDILIIPESWF